MLGRSGEWKGVDGSTRLDGGREDDGRLVVRGGCCDDGRGGVVFDVVVAEGGHVCRSGVSSVGLDGWVGCFWCFFLFFN